MNPSIALIYNEFSVLRGGVSRRKDVLGGDMRMRVVGVLGNPRIKGSRE